MVTKSSKKSGKKASKSTKSVAAKKKASKKAAPKAANDGTAVPASFRSNHCNRAEATSPIHAPVARAIAI